jgi:hypothetical protein
VTTNQSTTPTAPFTVCPRCHYPGHHPNAAAWGKKGGSAKVKKGFAVAGQPSTEARKLGWVKRKAKAEAKANEKASATDPTAPPPR